MTRPAAGAATVAGDYDRLPYPSMPFPDTQPARLAAVAALFGIAAPAAERARVLELGCAAGGNIIPLAARFPGARFTGVDLSPRQVEDGRARIAALGLGNVELQQADLATYDLAGATFDYVICQGVFSWVPRTVQDAILRICRDALAPSGVATISYNVLPGWHLRMVVRDLCLHYAGADADEPPQRRVARARAALDQVAAAADPADPYGMLLRTEARRLRTVPAAYVMGEFLARDNAPCQVGEFIDRAAAHGLDYLAEVDLCAAVPTTLDTALHARLTTYGSGRPALEQQIDFLTGRLFRRSVLVRQGPSGAVPGAVQPEALEALHVSGALRREAGKEPAVFTDARQRPITVKEPSIARAFDRIAAAYPETVALPDLGDADTPPELRARIRQAVLALVLAGRVSIASAPLRLGRAAAERPRAWPVARVEAAAKQPWITGLHHAGLPLTPELAALLPLLDGSNDKPALRAALAGLPGAPPLEAVLDHLTRNAILEPEAG